ncbi:chromosome segregation in meiosis protein 3 [Nannizzia gypsea CBS 118893]|uniref:Chromosome segregation in meiosis protein n=1 Tax=Arthroderma gypseum (strain ATCC MYA-4604 / CBS 118893) TaxID=535722 RepID=E4V609_ARTGP|nr:chromosome segregation in meiosis protein 3 [Nannizzia gypsea CBS 118893]EFR05534.1 chromosome segregation in meiosis protein 3 [Nannizzia gypsea CBS 118893]
MAANDNVDDLFDYDAGLDDILREVEQDTRKTTEVGSSQDQQNPRKGILGIDDELQVSRKRAPVAQLDEARQGNLLLSQDGIPKLRKMARKSLKIKGKGHEFSDAGRLLNFYRLWLDELYPRAKFADTLTIIEKLGHSKRIQVMRREWIDEGKPRSEVDDDGFKELGDISVEQDLPTREKGNRQQGTPTNPEEEDLFVESQQLEPRSSTHGAVKSLFGGDGCGQARTSNTMSTDNELHEWNDNAPSNLDRNEGKGCAEASGVGDSFPDEEDDLDRLLAGDNNELNSNSIDKPSATASTSNPDEDDYENDWEAMQEHDM